MGFPLHGFLASEAGVTTGTVSALAGPGDDRRFMQITARISEERLQEKVGSDMTVLVDEIDEDGNLAIARGPGDAPEIDGRVLIEDGSDLQPGEFASVRITAAGTYDLRARLGEHGRRG